MFLVLNTRQFTILEDTVKDGKGINSEKDRQLIQSLNNDHNHEQSAIIINQGQLDYLKLRIDLLKKESEKKDLTKNIEEAKNRSIYDQRKAKEYKEKFNEMMVLKLSTNLPLSSISTLFEESNFQDISKLEREIKTKEKEVSKEIVSKNEDIERLRRTKADMIGTITGLLKDLNDKKEKYQDLITRIDKEKETSLN